MLDPSIDPASNRVGIVPKIAMIEEKITAKLLVRSPNRNDDQRIRGIKI